MSSALNKMVPMFTGSNWQQWHTSMQAYLRAQGQWFVYLTTQPADGHDDRNNWDNSTERALGNITLRLAPSIQVAVTDLTTVKEVWDYLKKSFGAPSIGSAYTELSKLLSTTIPTGSHPAPAITKMLSHFTYLKDAGFDFPAPVQTMIILCKLPPTMEVVAQILSQTSPDKIKNLKLEGIVKAAMLSFEQKGATCGGGKGPQPNKLSAVKRKPADPKFAQQQQQQQQQGGSNSGASGNAPAQGQGGRTCRGGKKARARRENTQQAAFATYVHYDGPEPTVDPRALAHTPGATNFGPPTFDNTIKAFDLVHHLGVEPSCQTIHTLNQVVSIASANLDQPEAGPSSLKRPRLEERITMYEEDAISLGDDEPFAHEPFTDDEFNEIDAMVLDRYNMTSMAMDAEASLFRQVPSAHMLTNADTLPLHVRYTPSLYIASSIYNMSCRCLRNAYTCSCSDSCVACKGKMVDDSELSGAFWLLDSGASHHFTGDIGDFASYNALKRAHYAKTANGVALVEKVSA